MEEIKINPSGDETQEQGLNQEQGQAQGQKQDQEQEHQEPQAHPVIDGHPEFEFTITNSGADLYNFLLYHNYRSIQGAIGLFISAAALLLLIFNFQTLDYIKMGVLAVLALMFPVVNPLLLKSKATRQVRRNSSFTKPITYSFYAKGFVLSQNDQTGEIPWRSVFKVVDTGRCLVVYVSTIRAFIWPKSQLGEYYESVTRVFADHLEPYKIKFKRRTSGKGLKG